MSPSTLVSRPPGPRAPRRPPTVPPAHPGPRPLTLAGVLAAGQSAALGVLAVMVVVLVGWASAADSEASASTAVAGALQAWLVAHHATLTFPGGAFALAPVGLTLLPAVLLHVTTLRAGRATGITGRRGVVALTSSVTAAYAVVALAVALLARTDVVTPRPISAFLGAAAVAGVASATAAVRATGRRHVLWQRIPPRLRVALPAGAAAAAALLAGGALVAGLMLALHHDRAGRLVEGLDAGVGGGLLLLLGCLLYVPNAAAWAVSVATGPGFALGQGTSVTVAGADLADVPAFPLLAALPQGESGGLAWLLVALPVAAGALAGWLLRRSGQASSWRGDVERAAVAGAVAGLLVGALTGFAAGPSGPGRMLEVGPDWWAVMPATAVEIAAVALALLLVDRWWEGRRGSDH